MCVCVCCIGRCLNVEFFFFFQRVSLIPPHTLGGTHSSLRYFFLCFFILNLTSVIILHLTQLKIIMSWIPLAYNWRIRKRSCVKLEWDSSKNFTFLPFCISKHSGGGLPPPSPILTNKLTLSQTSLKFRYTLAGSTGELRRTSESLLFSPWDY